MCVDAPISPPLVSYGNICTSSCGVPPYWTFEINYCLVPMHPFPWKSPWKPFLTVSELVLVVKLCKCFYTVGCMILFFSLSLFTKHLGSMNRSRSVCDIDNTRFLKLKSEKKIVVKSNMLTSVCWSEMVISWSKLIFGTCWVVNQQIG